MKLLTKAQIIKEFANDQIELDYHLQDQADEMGVSLMTLAKSIAEEELSSRLMDGSVVMEGKKYKIL